MAHVTKGRGRHLTPYEVLRVYDAAEKAGRLTDEQQRARQSLWRWLAVDQRWRLQAAKHGPACRACGWPISKADSLQRWEAEGLGSCPDPMMVDAP